MKTLRFMIFLTFFHNSYNICSEAQDSADSSNSGSIVFRLASQPAAQHSRDCSSPKSVIFHSDPSSTRQSPRPEQEPTMLNSNRPYGPQDSHPGSALSLQNIKQKRLLNSPTSSHPHSPKTLAAYNALTQKTEPTDELILNLINLCDIEIVSGSPTTPPNTARLQDLAADVVRGLTPPPASPSPTSNALERLPSFPGMPSEFPPKGC